MQGCSDGLHCGSDSWYHIGVASVHGLLFLMSPQARRATRTVGLAAHPTPHTLKCLRLR
jgi:hypothetical protein